MMKFEGTDTLSRKALKNVSTPFVAKGGESKVLSLHDSKFDMTCGGFAPARAPTMKVSVERKEGGSSTYQQL